MSESYQRWQDRHPPLPPLQQSERAIKSMQLGGVDRRLRRQRTPVHSANWHMKTAGKADTRERLGHLRPCRCAAAMAQAQLGRITGLPVERRR